MRKGRGTRISSATHYPLLFCNRSDLRAAVPYLVGEIGGTVVFIMEHIRIDVAQGEVHVLGITRESTPSTESARQTRKEDAVSKLPEHTQGSPQDVSAAHCFLSRISAHSVMCHQGQAALTDGGGEPVPHPASCLVRLERDA